MIPLATRMLGRRGSGVLSFIFRGRPTIFINPPPPRGDATSHERIGDILYSFPSNYNFNVCLSSLVMRIMSPPGNNQTTVGGCTTMTSSSRPFSPCWPSRACWATSCSMGWATRNTPPPFLHPTTKKRRQLPPRAAALRKTAAAAVSRRRRPRLDNHRRWRRPEVNQPAA